MLDPNPYEPDQFFDLGIVPDEDVDQKIQKFKNFADRAMAAKGEVTNSVEFMRIQALPRRHLSFHYGIKEGVEGVPDVTPLFRKEGGTMSFRPIQSAALVEAAKANGLFAPMSVGAGKTLVTLALPEAVNSEKAVLLVPPRLKKQLGYEIEKYSEHFHLPVDRITIISYSELSSAKKQTILEDNAPDLIICDEAHNLRHRTSARTKRFLRFSREHVGCRFVFLSGTMTTRSITDYAHLIELALRKNSPIPAGYREVQDWAGAIDVKPKYIMLPGILTELCEPKEDVRDGYRRRMIETQGVVATQKEELGTSLVVQRLDVDIPYEVRRHIASTRMFWSLAGEEFESALTYHKALRQLACGFYYRWVWPNGEKDYGWLGARSAWHKEVRQRLKLSRKGMDSPLLLTNAAKRYWDWVAEGSQGSPPDNSWDSEAWPAWEIQKPKWNPTPPTETVWIDKFMVYRAIEWAEKQKKQKTPAIIWYEHNCLGEEISRIGGFPHYGAGKDSSQANEPVIVCSMRSQGVGMNLQHYSRNLFTSMPPNGAIFEQVAGRTHRMGQEADEVQIDWYGHTNETCESFQKAKEDAQYIQDSFGQPQKAVYATCLGGYGTDDGIKEEFAGELCAERSVHCDLDHSEGYSYRLTQI